MDQELSEEDRQRYDSYLNIHLKKEQRETTPAKQIEALQKRDRNKWFHLLINIAAILLFGYSFYFDVTRLSDTFFYIIAVIFMVNVVLIFYQKNQIKQLIDYLNRKQHE